MTNEQTGTLVLKDGAGTYFLVPQETLERGRVPEEHTAELEHAIAATQGGADEDTQGFLTFLVNPVTVVGVAIGYVATSAAIEASGGADAQALAYHQLLIAQAERIQNEVGR